MATISEAQNRLKKILDNHFGKRLPEDYSDWDMEDWTIYALDFLCANIDEAINGDDGVIETSVDACPVCDADMDKYDGYKMCCSCETKLYERMYEGSAFWTIVFNGLKTTGTFFDALSYIEEGLRPDEYEELSKFFFWLSISNKTLGHGNYWEAYMQFKKTHKEFTESEARDENSGKSEDWLRSNGFE